MENKAVIDYNIRKKVIIVSLSAFACGFIYSLYSLYKYYKSKNNDKNRKNSNEKSCNDEIENGRIKSKKASNNFKVVSITNTHNSTFVKSLDDITFAISTQVNLFYPNIVENKISKENNYDKKIPSKSGSNISSNNYFGNNNQNLNLVTKHFNEEENLYDNNNYKGNFRSTISPTHNQRVNKFSQGNEDNLDLSALKKSNTARNNLFFIDKSPIKSVSNKPSSNKASIDVANTTLINLVNDIKDPNKSKIENHNIGGTSIYLPTIDLDEELRLAEAGYLEEDDEDLRSSGMSAGFFGLDDEDNVILANKVIKEKENKNVNDELNKSIIEIKTHQELENILLPKSQYDINPYKIYTIKSIVINDIEIIDENMILIILKYLFNELNEGMIELSDNFTDERRKYFSKNFEVYISLVNMYIKNKEEFFLGVLSQIMSKLSISQNLLDNSLKYYMNEANETPSIVEIRKAYEKVYRAGEKYSIAPKVLTKLRIKSILEFQYEIFKKYRKSNPEFNSDVLDIIVCDTVYSELGFDKDAIRAAELKHDIINDPTFESILSKIEEIKNISFIG